MRLVLLALSLVLLLPSPASAAAWVWPLPGPHTVSRPFAPGASPYAPGHRGADLPGTPGQTVRAAGDGTVSYAGLLAGRGVVVVTHGVLRTTYEPVGATVHVGEPVTAGERIGTLEPGHAGCPVAACLHWGLLRGATYLDPVQLVDPGPVRLLPREPPGQLSRAPLGDAAVTGTSARAVAPLAGGAVLPAPAVEPSAPTRARPTPAAAAARAAGGAAPVPPGPLDPLLPLGALLPVTALGVAAARLGSRRRAHDAPPGRRRH